MGRKLELNWLKNDQRLFLERDYLQNGQTPEDRYLEICDTIEKYCLKMATTTESIDYCRGIGKRFEDYISKGWVSFATPVLINFGKPENLPISCVDEDTWINTIDGGKMAKNIKVGDSVLTHKGRFRKVTDVIPTPNREDIWRLKVVNRMTPLLLTGDHKVKTNLGWVRVDELDTEKHLIAGNDIVDFGLSQDYIIDLKDYTKYDFIINDGKICKSIERNVESNSIKNNKNENFVTYYSEPNEYVEVTEELAWAIGLWFADGSVSKNNKKHPNGIRLTQHLKEEDIVIKWLDIMKKSFNLNGNYYKSEVESSFSKRGKASWISVNLNGGIIGEFFNSFGEGALKKEIPNWVLKLPKEKLQKFLDGVLSGDGHIKNNKNVLTLSNPVLLLQMYNIALKLGHNVSLQMQQKPSVHNKTTYVYNLTFRNYKISTSKASASAGIKYEDGLVYFPIRELEKTDLVRNVFDFTVEEDHSFSCAGVVVHNCNKSMLEDSLDDIYKGVHELGMLAKYGAGTSQNFSNLRPIGSDISTGGTSNSVMDWIELYADMMSKTNQNRARRGFLTAYLSVDHPEIMDFLDIGTHRIPTDKQRFFQTITTAVTLPIGWRQSLKDGDKDKRKIWAKILKTRKEVGFPYILDLENANANRPQWYVDRGLYIKTSNICIETNEIANKDKTFACCLSSTNAYYFDEWENHPNFIFDMNLMLDCVIEDYIEKGSKLPGLEKAVRFAKEHRSIGLGILAFCSFLQKKGIIFGEIASYAVNKRIFSKLRSESDRASIWMAKHFGEPEMLKGYGYRNTTRLAQAPTKSTSYIMGGETLNLSEGVEPHKSNYTSKKLAKIQSEVKNKELVDLLETKGKNTKEIWSSILTHNGSVQHLDFLDEREKAIFRTFSEISQVDVLKLAGQRAKLLDQGQSINIMIHPDTPASEINKLHMLAFDEGIKGLYYQYSINAAQEFNKELLTCSSCEA